MFMTNTIMSPKIFALHGLCSHAKACILAALSSPDVAMFDQRIARAVWVMW
jgi:hypothetical protein